MPVRQKNPELYQQSRMRDSTLLGSVLPVVIATLCGLGQYFFTDYLDRVPHWAQLSILLLVIAVYAARAIMKEQSSAVRFADSVVLHLITVLSVSFLTPLPSPYLLFVMLMTTMTYLRFGYRAMLWSLWGMFAAVTAAFFIRYGFHNHEQFGLYLTTYVLIMVMTYYSIVYLRYAEMELRSVSNISDKAVSQQKQIESLINNISDGVIAVDKNFRVIVYNGAAMNVLDLNTDIKGKLLSRILKPVNAESQPVKILEVLKETMVPTINRDLCIKYADGSTSNLFLGIAPVYLGYGKSENNGYTLLLRDITREKSLEEERDEFISVVSHELRTPIAITEGNISNAQFIAEKTGDMAVIKQTLKESHNQVLFLADMINDLSTLSRAERGVLEVDVESINVHDLVVELQSNYTPQAKAKGLELNIELDPKLELLKSSKLYSREILQNFITNAIKYTEKGSVTIRALTHERGVRFEIQDTGIGISKADQDRVYDKFFRSEDYRTRANNGTGLGLYVTMKLIKLIHAEVDLKSELNKGSVFGVMIPNLAVTTPKKK